LSASIKAVFLSYASQDAEAARKICDALSAAGVEVWFDRSELRGGDAWDARIRKQIKECALFVPIISANTEQRQEGYFRLEWKLAEDRSHLMARGKPFIVPIAADATSERSAEVPDSFLAVQWTRLPGGEVPAAFVARVRALLGRAEIEKGRSHPVRQDEGAAAPVVAARRPAFPSWAWAAVVLTIVLGVGAFFAFRPSANQTPSVEAQQRFLAVLPFANLSEDRDNTTAFAEGMHDEVITALGKIAALKVIGRTSVLPYGDPKQRNLRKIAADLGIGTVVEGTVRRAGNKVRLVVQLVDAQTSRQLWGDTYERELIDVFAIQAAIAQEVATRLNATLTPGARTLLARRPTENPRAHELYLQAKLLHNRLTVAASLAEWERATSVLDEAVAADPRFAQAYALLSRIHSQIYGYSPRLDPNLSRREHLARQALAMAKSLAPAAPETRLAEGGFALNCEDDAAKTLSLCEPLLEELPNDEELIFLIGLAERFLGRHVEGAASLRRAQALNPRDLNIVSNLMTTLIRMRRFAEAAELGGRYQGPSKDYDAIMRNMDFIRFELDGDRVQLARSVRAHPIRSRDPNGAYAAYQAALISGDLADAAQLIAEYDLPTVSPTLFQTEPTALQRALVAFLLGQHEAAASHAAEATAYYLREPARLPRDQPFVNVGLAMAAVCAGQNARALGLAAALRKEIAGKTGRNQVALLNELGRVYALLGERETALEILRELMTGASNFNNFGTPRLARIDPCWSRLAADPRFDEILKAAKPL
jgi:TolB-like protein